MSKQKLVLFCTLVVLTIVTSVFPQSPKRSEVPDKYKWNLSDMYPNLSDWQADIKKVESSINDFASYKGKLGESSQNLLNALNSYFGLLKTFYKAGTYASNLSNEDVRISENQALLQQLSSVGTKFGETASFFEPEILTIPKEKIETFFKEKPGLEVYSMYIDNIQRLRPHTLSEAEEKILASFGLIAGNQNTVYSIFADGEKPNPKITLSDGKEVELSPSVYTGVRTIENRDDRKKVFEAFFNSYGDFKNTLGANLVGKVKKDWVYAKDKKYNTSLEYALNGDNLPPTVYTTLIDQVNKSLPTLYRFLDLKKRMLGVDELHYYDLYTPLVKKVDLKFTVEEGQQTILDALKPMNSEYLATVKKSFDNRWIDFIPTEGKRSGAYSSGSAYDVHPYILMNWNDDYESVSTLAHEMGHTMHSYYSNSNQPFPKADYSTFVAEIASTINETLLNNYMVAKAKSDEEKLFLLGSYLDLLRTTIFRQTSFAEFELEIHKRIEQGQPLTGDDLCNIYYDIVKKYYGQDAGHCVVDPYIQYEWAYIPHFMGYTYYVFQYSTSLIYATAFAEKIVNEGTPAVDNFYKILKGGGSKYAVELIKDAGIDPLSSEPFELTMKKMNKVMDQIEEILNK
ncbi:MAG TPA: oligoendopeptidase F [Ignavibacteriales bacterium]|nr:oligoendopeptidase F [Ignavibacteriales bacterium]